MAISLGASSSYSMDAGADGSHNDPHDYGRMLTLLAAQINALPLGELKVRREIARDDVIIAQHMIRYVWRERVR